MYRIPEVFSKPAALAFAALSAVLAPQALAGTISLPIGTSVNVTNSASSPVPVTITGTSDNPAFTPFTTSLPAFCSSGGSSFGVTLGGPPSGYTWVVETIDIAVSVTEGVSPILSMQTSDIGGPVAHVIPLIAQGSDTTGRSHYAANQAVKYYLGAGPASAFLTTLGTASSSICVNSVSMSGYLVKTP